MKEFYRRSVVCFSALLLLMLAAATRVATSAVSEELKEAATAQSTKKVELYRVRGAVTDCNGVMLTDTLRTAATVVFPTEKAAVVLSELLCEPQLGEKLTAIRSGRPVTVTGQPTVKGGWQGFFIPQRYSGRLCHVLGYVGSDGHGVTGIEKAFDDLLYTGKSASISYVSDSEGRMIEGLGTKTDNAETESTVTLTVDSRIQTVAEQATENIGCGAAVVLEAGTGKLRAVVSRPFFDPDNVSLSLNDTTSPLINRAVSAYNVGSVYKPCVAAAALENGLGDYRYRCTGSITVDGHTFKCNRSGGHGELGLKEALAVSCNTYFYTLGQKLGADKLYSVTKALRFGEAADCGGGLVSSAGSVPSLEKLRALPTELTNLTIGQGDLLLSPIALAVMYSCIVCGGEYRLPYIVQSVTDGTTETRYSPSPPTEVFGLETADTLKEYLINVLTSGTGGAAYSENIVSGGKTGTAQTGWLEDGRRVLNGWFCGFYEGKSETYVVVVLKEDVSSGSADCAPIFKKIVEDMAALGF